VQECIFAYDEKKFQDEDNSQDTKQIIRQDNWSIREDGKEGQEYML